MLRMIVKDVCERQRNNKSRNIVRLLFIKQPVLTHKHLVRTFFIRNVAVIFLYNCGCVCVFYFHSSRNTRFCPYKFLTCVPCLAKCMEKSHRIIMVYVLCNVLCNIFASGSYCMFFSWNGEFFYPLKIGLVFSLCFAKKRKKKNDSFFQVVFLLIRDKKMC